MLEMGWSGGLQRRGRLIGIGGARGLLGRCGGPAQWGLVGDRAVWIIGVGGLRR